MVAGPAPSSTVALGASLGGDPAASTASVPSTTGPRRDATSGARPSTHRSTRSSSSRPASRRRSWMARWSSRASPSAQQVGRELRVDDQDEPVAVRDRGPRSRRRLDLDLVGCQGDPGERDRAVRLERHGAVARGGHHGRDRGAEPLADLRQERLHAPLDEVRVVVDDHDGPDVDLLGDDPQERGVDVQAAIGQGQPGPCQRLAGPDPRRAAQRPGQVDGVLGHGHGRLEPRVAMVGQLVRRPAGQVDAVGRVGQVGREVPVHRLGHEREDRGEHPRRGEHRLVERRERPGAIGGIGVRGASVPATAAGTRWRGRP